MPGAVTIPRPAQQSTSSTAGAGSPMSWKTLAGSFGRLPWNPATSPTNFMSSALDGIEFPPQLQMSSSVESSSSHFSPPTNALCKDYTCCGLPLTDLHALVEHFEDVHVRVVSEESLDPNFPALSFPSGTAPDCSVPVPDNDDDLELDIDMEMDDAGSSGSSSASPPTTPSLATTSAFDTTSIFLPRRFPFPHIPTALSQQQRSSTPDSCVTPSLLFTPQHTPTHSRPPSPHSAQPSTLSNSSSSAVTPNTAAPAAFAPSMQPPRPAPPGTKPFRCPTPNCTKSYKQANGLKYHVTHGQCSFAPPDPALEALSDKEADERLRPFVCAVGSGTGGKGGGCGRRYKNMNGLRYHYQHSGAHGAVGLALLASGQHPAPNPFSPLSLNGTPVGSPGPSPPVSRAGSIGGYSSQQDVNMQMS